MSAASKKVDEGFIDLKKEVIGLARLPQSTKPSLVIEYSKEENFVVAIDVSHWLAKHETHTSIPKEKVILFPDGKSLHQMLVTPFAFQEFVKENNEFINSKKY